MQHGWEIPTP
jgi:hypothetical protein